MTKRVLDIVVAVRNEEETLKYFIDKVRGLPLPPDIELRTIFVEDSSTDNTRPMLRALAKEDPRFRYLFLKRGYGQAAAIALGLSRSDADGMIMMDVDGGHPLNLIPSMIQDFLEGADIVQSIRRKISSRNRYRDLGTYAFNHLFKFVTGIHTERQNVYYRLVSQAVCRELLKNNRWKHFLRIDYSSVKKLKITYREFDATERISGVSKYNLRRLVKFAIKAILSTISLGRFIVLEFALFLSTFIFLTTPAWILSVASIGTFLYLLKEFLNMSRVDILKSMEVNESSF